MKRLVRLDDLLIDSGGHGIADLDKVFDEHLIAALRKGFSRELAGSQALDARGQAGQVFKERAITAGSRIKFLPFSGQLEIACFQQTIVFRFMPDLPRQAELYVELERRR